MTFWIALISLAVNIVQLMLLAYFIWRIRSIQAPDLLSLDKALHQRVDFLEGVWQVKWDGLSNIVKSVQVKLKNFL